MKIGIISLGLIGGSLFKCLTETEHQIYAVTRNKETIEKAKQYSAFVSEDINILKDCNVIFVASPIHATIKILDLLENIVNKNTVVLDCASIKEFVMKKKYNYKFIGSHPMAGTENSGFNFSFKELFQGSKWILTPSDNSDAEDIEKVKKIIEITGAKIIIADAKKHDLAVALISHMPLLISQALFKTAMNNQLALQLASSGFRDMTRLAMSNPIMANDMMHYNKENIENCLEMLRDSIDFLQNSKYIENITDIKNIRSSMYSSEGKNIF